MSYYRSLRGSPDRVLTNTNKQEEFLISVEQLTYSSWTTRLHDTITEKRPTYRHKQVITNRPSPSVFTTYCYLGFVATKCSRIFKDPLQCQVLIKQTLISARIRFTSQMQESKSPQSVV